jgi:hypothetical protein
MTQIREFKNMTTKQYENVSIYLFSYRTLCMCKFYKHSSKFAVSSYPASKACNNLYEGL